MDFFCVVTSCKNCNFHLLTSHSFSFLATLCSWVSIFMLVFPFHAYSTNLKCYVHTQLQTNFDSRPEHVFELIIVCNRIRQSIIGVDWSNTAIYWYIDVVRLWLITFKVLWTLLWVKFVWLFVLAKWLNSRFLINLSKVEFLTTYGNVKGWQKYLGCWVDIINEIFYTSQFLFNLFDGILYLIF